MTKRYLQEEYGFEDMQTDIENFKKYLVSQGADISHSESGDVVCIEINSTIDLYREFATTINYFRS